ncbi:Gfo/Idh/MocA family oxidoreductase [Saccharothrix sp. SC076]|nr:Gfo/Idh/MocA family oxidoreductase [Saccharothrix obliqua]
MNSTSPRKPLGVGIVGLSANGGWGARGHLPALRAVDGFEVRGLVGSTPESAARSAAEFGVPLSFTSVADLAAHDDIDLVVVAVKVPLHRELIVPALEARKVVFSEWPLATGSEEAAGLAALAAEHGVRTAVGLQARSHPSVRYLHDLVKDGYVGEVLSTSIVASGGGWGATVPSRNEYTADRDNGATLMTVPFGHTLDAFTLCLSGFTELNATTATRRPTISNADTGKPVRQTAEDQIAVTGTLESGAVASMHFRGGSSRGTNLLWEINGSEGDLVVAGDSGHLQFGQFTLWGARGKDAKLSELTTPAIYHAIPGVSEVWSGVAHAYNLLRSDIEAGTSTVPDFAHATEHHRLLDRITRAAATGRRQ